MSVMEDGYNTDPEQLILPQTRYTFQVNHLKFFIAHLTNLLPTSEILVRNKAWAKYLKQGLSYISYHVYQLFPLP